jgi:hypothetical protein
MLETVVIRSVEKKNDKWYRVVLADDDRVPETNDAKLADRAQELSGQEVQVEIGHKKNGKFDNYYLNKIVGEGGSLAAPARKVTSKPSESESFDTRKQRQINRQWAYGRSLEVFIASGVTPAQILGEEFELVKQLAERLAAETQVD